MATKRKSIKDEMIYMLAYELGCRDFCSQREGWIEECPYEKKPGRPENGWRATNDECAECITQHIKNQVKNME